MKNLVLSIIVLFLFSGLTAQTVFTTADGGGDFSDPATWDGGVAPPANCNCVIRVQPQHSLTINTPVSLSEAVIELRGTNSQLLFSSSNDLQLTGTSAIDVQNTAARIYSNNTGNQIQLAGTTIYTGNTTTLNSAVPGEILGYASASSERASVSFINAVLPVALTEFRATETNGAVSLNWSTSAEINAELFQVERSKDSKAWQAIGQVNAAGNSITMRSYAFTDVLPTQGTNFYRLKMVDLDNAYSYSPVRSVQVGAVNSTIALSPNPSRSVLFVSVNQPDETPFRIKLMNSSGQVVYDKQHRGVTNRIPIQTENLPQGVFLLQLTDNKGLNEIRKVIVSR